MFSDRLANSTRLHEQQIAVRVPVSNERPFGQRLGGDLSELICRRNREVDIANGYDSRWIGGMNLLIDRDQREDCKWKANY